MNRDNLPWRPLAAAAIDWRNPATPRSSEFGDIYYSCDNGPEEARHVFLRGSDLPARWRAHPGAHFCVAETGFGTGLNFLLTWQAWRNCDNPRPRLHYVSVEKHPLARGDFAAALDNWPQLQPLTGHLLQHYPPLLPGQHRLVLERGRVTLDLWWEDAAAALADLASRGAPLVDAWDLDGFAPSRNAAMWSEQVLCSVAALSHPGATVATFTAAGQVRRGLAKAGFTVRKIPGYGRKRESLAGVRTTAEHPVTAAATDTPWDLPSAAAPRPTHVLVLGGGLAGCSAAAALARRGVAVTLLEQGALAGAGSGNSQGILYTRLSHRHSALTDFALQSFWFARGYYSALFDCGQLVRGVDGELCGALQQTTHSGVRAALADALHSVPELAQAVDARRACELLGIETERGGYWYPGSGWLHPPAVCRALARTDGVTALEQTGALRLQYRSGQWCALAGDNTLARASCAVVATGVASAAMAQLDWLPLQAIRGQTTHLPSDDHLGRLRAVLCHEGYVAPARQGEHCIGATFDPRDDESRLRANDHGKNLAALATAIPTWRDALQAFDPAQLGGRVGYRCASPDYLPLVGPVPDLPAFLRDYGALRKNARQRIPHRGHYMSGLYLDTAHGSRGLSSAPLAAELLASQICGEPPPLDRQLCRALAPARFLIRELARGRI